MTIWLMYWGIEDLRKQYDYLIVGSGLFGSVFAYEAARRGKTCLVVEKRPHAGGNIYTKTLTEDGLSGISQHMYGAHIFHTDSREIWEYVNQFCEFNNYVNSPVAIYHNPETDADEMYNLPFNMNTFYQLFGAKTPQEAKAAIEREIAECGITGEPKNLEEQGLRLSKTVFTKLVKEYTEKQWQRDCRELPASTIRRLPFRFRFDNNYFNDRYQGIPIGGYTQIIEKMLADEKIDVLLQTEYFDFIKETDIVFGKTVYTGQIDAFFGFSLGRLQWRTVYFEDEILDTDNYQGNAVVNYTSHDRPFTRIIEHKFFEAERFADTEKTVISKEFSTEWKPGMDPYYPISDERNSILYEKYRMLAQQEENVIFGGRLGLYQYFDMDDCILSALAAVKEEFGI